MKYILILLSLFLIACEKVPITVISADKVVQPTIQYQVPPKQILSSIEWDFPRLSDQAVVKNSSVCIEEAKILEIDHKGVYPIGDLEKLSNSCKVPAIDEGSNLYIGLTEANYRNLVHNYNILMTREKRWKHLLDEINKMLRLQNPEPEKE